jgi:Lanthionine synthetase C-like protein/Protein kinase domain
MMPSLTARQSFGGIVAAASAPSGWEVWQPPAQPWICVSHPDAAPVPEQGWKLHVSASAISAEDVLGAILPSLLEERVTFKLAQSPAALEWLNQGGGGLSQVGKFVTVYPADDAQAVRLAVRLDQATRGLRGPSVPSDRPLRAGSLVHYRFGGFGSRYLQTPLGEIVPALADPQGRLVPDRRLSIFSPPAWARDPFEAAGVSHAPQPGGAVIGGRYLLLTTMHRAPRGAVYLAVDLAEQRRCVLKQAERNATIGLDGRDAQDRLRREAAVLSLLAPDTRFPALYDLFEHNEALYLAMEDVEGLTFEAHVNAALAYGRLPGDAQVVAWGRELASLFGAIHARGLVYRDVKSPNVIVAPEGRLRLLDFELAHGPALGGTPYGVGTLGYVSPQQLAGEAPAATDDVYGVGALLYLAASGGEPSRGASQDKPLTRPISLLNPACGRQLQAVIARCLHPDAGRRFASMQELDEALASLSPSASLSPPAFGAERPRCTEPTARRRARGFASRLADTICSMAVPDPTGAGKTWQSTHRAVAGAPSRDLNAGSAGPLLVLAELVARLGQTAHREVLADGARGLLNAPRPDGEPVPGLYVGEAGVATALLRAGQALKDPELIQAAEERGAWIATLPYRSPDLYNGTAGRARLHVWLWDATAEPRHLRHATAAGDALLAAAEEAGAGALRWRIPPGYEGLSGAAHPGYAHGAAGIADSLLDVWEVTGQERFVDAARKAARWLERLAIPVLHDNSGLDWAHLEGMPPSSGLWCHGAAGVGRFFVHAARIGGVHPRAAELAAAAARAAARSGRWASPVQCHGLAGNIELLIDTFQSTGERAYLREARSLGHLLEAFATEVDGLLVWPSEQPWTFSPDYMVGYAGVAACWLRLSDPRRLPHLLSRATFGARRGAP